MKKGRMRLLNRMGLLIILFPFVLIAGFVLFEIVGMAVNHYATGRQTKHIINVVRDAVADADVKDSYSETGNTSGTGNHVDMLSVVIFQTKESREETEKNIRTAYPEADEWGFYVESIEAIEKNKNEDEWVPGYYDSLSLPEDKNDCYLVYLCKSAPFEDNIEGH